MTAITINQRTQNVARMMLMMIIIVIFIPASLGAAAAATQVPKTDSFLSFFNFHLCLIKMLTTKIIMFNFRDFFPFVRSFASRRKAKFSWVFFVAAAFQKPFYGFDLVLA
jgi:hypothetical protein